MTIRILLADDQPRVRFALRVLLEKRPEMIISGEAVDADDLITLLTETRPELLILDLSLPGLAEKASLKMLRELVPNLAIIAMSSRPELGPQALDEGADAFISKIDPPEHLLEIIHDLQLTLDQDFSQAPVK